jgi:hypothetical protein
MIVSIHALEIFFAMSLRQFLPEVPLPGSIQREHRLHPFRPASLEHRYGEDSFVKLRKKQKQQELQHKFYEKKKRSKVRYVTEAETGEVIKLTKSIWTAEEGQLGNGILNTID